MHALYLVFLAIIGLVMALNGVERESTAHPIITLLPTTSHH